MARMISREEVMKVMQNALATALAVAALGAGGTAVAADPLKIVFTHHSSVSNSFWRGVKRGFDQACTDFGADCKMLFTNTEGSIADQVNNMRTAIATQPDAIVTAIADDAAICPVVKEATDLGIIVIASNVDALSGDDCGRAAYVGQNFIDAGEVLGSETVKLFPTEGPIRVLLGISAPGGNWSEDRAKGIENALEAYKSANPGREIVVDRIDSGTDLAVVAERVTAYYDAHPDLTAYFDMGMWEASFARVLEERGIPAGKVILAGFDVIPEVVDYMEKGYIQKVVNQGPFLQGYLPVVQVNLMKNYYQSAWSVDSGRGVFDIEGARAALESFK
ncbi:substrate-binding domain-containing protein [Devosia sp.]|jgi:simple sugar transport system substrate-binding protein|uniref:substrate-binding domain-containing protein n=1 Tax=Devosia sp. TaxID=1871048 RepID=UPI0037BF7DF9